MSRPPAFRSAGTGTKVLEGPRKNLGRDKGERVVADGELKVLISYEKQ